MTITIILFLLLIAGMFFPKSKIITICDITLGIIILGFNSSASDLGNYKLVYEELFTSNLLYHYEPLYSLFMVICSKIGLSFWGFHFVWGTIVVIILEMSIYRLTKNTAMASGLLLFFTVLTSVSGMRASLAGALAVFGITYLKDKTRKSFYKSLLFVFLAAMVHYSSAFYFVVVFLYGYKGSEIKQKKIRFIILADILGVFLFSCCMDLMFNILSMFTSREKTLMWLSAGLRHPNIKGFMVPVCIVLFNCFVNTYMYRFSKKTTDYHTVFILPYAVSIYMLLIIPFLAIHDTFMRLIYEIMPIWIIPWCNLVSVSGQNRVSFYPKYVCIYSTLFICFVYNNISYTIGASRFFWIDALYNNFILSRIP